MCCAFGPPVLMWRPVPAVGMHRTLPVAGLEEPAFVIQLMGRRLAELGLCLAGVCLVGLSRGTVTTTFLLRSRGLSDKGEGPG